MDRNNSKRRRIAEKSDIIGWISAKNIPSRFQFSIFFSFRQTFCFLQTIEDRWKNFMISISMDYSRFIFLNKIVRFIER